MNKNKLTALALGATLSAFAAGCGTTPTSNANGNTTPSNVGTVTNNNGNTNTAGVVATNTTATSSNGDFNTRYGRNYNYNVKDTEFGNTAAEYGREAKAAGYTIGSGAKDGYLHFKTRGALLAAEDLRESTINVDVDNNVVTLKGTVATQAQSKKAEATAKAIDGVTSVKNNLQISPNDSVMTPGTGNANANTKSSANHSGNANH